MAKPDQSRLSLEHEDDSLEFEMLISDLSSDFVNLPPDEMDRRDEGALRRVCEFLEADSSVLRHGQAYERRES